MYERKSLSYFFTNIDVLTWFLWQREKASQEKLDTTTEYSILGFGKPSQKIYTDGKVRYRLFNK